MRPSVSWKTNNQDILLHSQHVEHPQETVDTDYPKQNKHENEHHFKFSKLQGELVKIKVHCNILYQVVKQTSDMLSVLISAHCFLKSSIHYTNEIPVKCKPIKHLPLLFCKG